MPRLSVAIIAFNEAANLPHCLRSVSWADEIVVVDGGSTDRTVQLATEHGARIVLAPDWQGFGVQKNRAIDACTGDWILALDADERVDEALRRDIEVAITGSAFDVYAMPRRSTYCGRYLRHGGWWPDPVTRLFKRGTARYSPARVHERLETDRPVGRLNAALTHFSFRSMEQVLDKVNRYSTEGALMVRARGETPGLLSAIGHGIAAFLRTYVLKLGFLDGRHGFLLAVSNAEGSYYRYVKAMLAAETRRDDRE